MDKSYWLVRSGILYKMKTLNTTKKNVELSVEFKNGKIRTKKIWFKNLGSEGYAHSWDLDGTVYNSKEKALEDIQNDADRDIYYLKEHLESSIKKIERRLELNKKLWNLEF